MNKSLPKELTSYDLLKTAAIVVVLIDHVVGYFMPGMIWVRALTHPTLTIWFFLIGHARSRDTGPHLWAAMLFLTASDFIAGRNILPLNILSTILLARLALGPYLAVAMRHGILFWAGALALFLLSFPTMFFVDYGTMGILLAVFGFLIREYGDDPHRKATLIFPFLVFCSVGYTVQQWSVFHFTGGQGLTVLAGTVGVMLMLSGFRPVTVPRVQAFLRRPLTRIFQITGRHTLFIYVAHYIIIKAVGMWLYPAAFPLLGWRFFPRFF